MGDYINKIQGDGIIKVLENDPDTHLLTEVEVTICEWALGDIILDTIPRWEDRNKYLELQGSTHDLITGETIQQIFERKTKGMPITLSWDGKEGALLTATVDSLRALANEGEAFDFTDGNETVSVLFDYSKENPVDMISIDSNEILMKGTIYLRRAA